MAYSLSRRGYGILKTADNIATITALRRDLTVKPISFMGDEASVGEFPVYCESEEKFYMPRVYGLTRFGLPPEDAISLKPGSLFTESVNGFAGQLRPQQEEAVKAYLEAANDPLKRGGVLCLQCGGGKTVIALWLIAHFKRKTIIVVHKEFLMEQWRERIEAFLPGLKVGILKATKAEFGADILIASIQSLSMKIYDEKLFKP